MLDNTDAFDKAWDNIAVRLREINQTLICSPPSVRFDIQRNLVQVVEELTLHQPMHPEILKAVREVAEGMIEGYEGRGRVHIGLRRLADGEVAPQDGSATKVQAFASLRAVFSQNAKTDAYLLNCLLACRSADGELALTPWGHYVLDYLDNNAEEARECHAGADMNKLHPDR